MPQKTKRPLKTPLKVMTILGTRPEIIRLSRIMARLDRYTKHVMVFTGQSYDYEMSDIFFKELGVRKPDYFLEVKSETLGGQIAKVIERSEEVLRKEKPDALLVLGDTNSALSTIMAKRMKVPIFHMEAGNRAFDENIPEEINRRIIDHISDINLPYGEHSRHNLLREGIAPGTLFTTGSPMPEVLAYARKSITSSKALSELKLKKGGYFVASFHREENVDSKKILRSLADTLAAVAKTYRMPVIVSTHPRTAKLLKALKIGSKAGIRFEKPFGYFDWMHLQENAFCVLSDSGTVPEESSLLGFPAVQVRVSAERPEAYDEGILVLSGLETASVLRCIDLVTGEKAEKIAFKVPTTYQGENVSSKVVRHIMGLAAIIARKRRG